MPEIPRTTVKCPLVDLYNSAALPLKSVGWTKGHIWLAKANNDAREEKQEKDKTDEVFATAASATYCYFNTITATSITTRTRRMMRIITSSNGNNIRCSNRKLLAVVTPLLILFLWSTFRLHLRLCSKACPQNCSSSQQELAADHSWMTWSSRRQKEVEWDAPDGTKKKCLSPEMDKRWIFGDNCTFVLPKTNQNISSSDGAEQHHQQQTTCTFCRHQGRYRDYFETLSEQLRAHKETECTSLIVYGVAFGEIYFDWLNNHNRADKEDEETGNTYADRVLRRHGSCFLTFVLAESLNATAIPAPAAAASPTSDHRRDPPPPRILSLDRTSSDGLMIFVPIHRQDLPYVSMRRNTKLFKMMGQVLFHWSQRIVWQDTKLLADPSKPQNLLPTDYFQYFAQTIDRYGVCASFMALPLHKNTVGSSGLKRQSTVQFASHCKAISEASVKRPTVSDSLATLHSQCSAYQTEIGIFNQRRQEKQQQQQKSKSSDEQQLLRGERHLAAAATTTTTTTSMDRALIDSAFMVWDMRSKRCRDFVAKLCCGWLDEIHCYSDRDQVSFPFAFVKMGMHEMDETDGVVPERHHRLFTKDSRKSPLVHITKSSCHWYYKPLEECDFGQDDEAPEKSFFSRLLPSKTA